MARGSWKGGALSGIGIILVISLAMTSHPGVNATTQTTPVCSIQGSSFSTPYAGEEVSTLGVVFADLDDTSQRGFFIQKENCDWNPDTSDGIFIYLGERIDVVSAGDQVWVSGTAQEYYGMTEILVNPTDVQILSTGNPLPAAKDLNPPFDPYSSRLYFESLEGMHVGLAQGIVVGPTDSRQRTWLVRADLGISRVFHDDLAGTGEVICVDDEGHFEITPQAKVSDQVLGLSGVLDFRGGLYCMQLLEAPSLLPASGDTAARDVAQSLRGIVSIASFNLANLFDRVDDPLTEDSLPSQAAYDRKLQKLALAIHDGMDEPLLIGVQEAENLGVLSDLVAQPEILNEYGILLEDGPDARGLDVGLLYQMEKVRILEYQVRQGCTSLVDGLGPDGNLDVRNPQNELTCDTDGDAVLDGNRLFSRPPLVVQMDICLTGCSGSLPGNFTEDWMPLILINNHWKSKLEDDDYQYTLPRRMEQAQMVASIMDELSISNSGVPLIVVGDLNDYSSSSPLETITSRGFENLFLRLEKESQYTYIFRGISGVLDHILVRIQPEIAPLWLVPVHINADYPYALGSANGTYLRSSDHDPFLVAFGVLDLQVYLPTITFPP